jgi:flagellar basal body-associated protein FliL
MKNIKWILIGVVIGMTMTSVAFAATFYHILKTSNGTVVSSTNPLPVQSY